MTTKESVQTRYGDVEVDLVTCGSCGNEELKEDAKRFEVGHKKGWACQMCYEEGFIDLPSKKRQELGDIAVYIACWPFVLAHTLGDPDIDSGEKEDILIVTVGTALWMFISALPFILG